MWEKHRIFTHDEVYGIIQQKTWIIHSTSLHRPHGVWKKKMQTTEFVFKKSSRDKNGPFYLHIASRTNPMASTKTNAVNLQRLI